MNNNIAAKGLSSMNSNRSLPLIINLFAMIFIYQTSIAQNGAAGHTKDNYRATQWTINEGLSNNDNYYILKDIKGFVWMGSGNGLNRFDGNSFKYYFSDKSQKTSIPSNKIMGMVEDSLHNIWIGTAKGLSRYDIRADSFTNFSSSGGIMPLLFASMPFWSTKETLFYFDYNAYGIMSYNVRSLEKKIVIKLSPADSMGVRGTKFFYSIFDEKNNCFWMLPERSKGELLQISLKDGKRTYYAWPVYKNTTSGTNYTEAEAMRLDKNRNCIWINSPQGLLNFTLNDKQFHRVDALNKFTDLKGYDRLVGIDFDTKGRIWFATQPAGLIIYNPTDQSVELPFPNDSATQVNTAMYNACVYCDKDGIIWTGSWLKTGVYQIVPFSKTVSHYRAEPGKLHSLSNDAVVRLVAAEAGKIWIGTFKTLEIFDPVTDVFETLTAKDLPGIKPVVTEQKIFPVYIDTIQRRALIESNTLYQMDMSTRKCIPFVFKDSTGQVITLSSDAGIFSLGFGNGAIVTIDQNSRKRIFFASADSTVSHELLSFASETITSYLDVINDQMISFTLEPGDRGRLTYTYAHNQLIRTPIFLDSIPWNEVLYNKKDLTYWIASERHLLHLNKDFGVIHTYTSNDGLPAIDISGLTLDNKNNLWFHTDRSIHQLNTETGEFSQLSEKDGFEKMDFLNYPGSEKASNADIYFPTGYIAQGFTRIHPDKFVSPPSSVYIESILVNQNPISFSSGANFLDELTLPYSENIINISTGIVDYFSNGKNRLRYKLEGQDTNWQYSPYYSTIRYEGLTSGKKYKLLMQASNASNEFNGPVKSLLIYITPAYWETWWFRIAAVIAIGLLFYGIIRWRLQQKFRLQLERSEKEIQIAEIKQKSTELEMQALRAQMNPHFIFNSLNSINRFILQNNKAQASEYLTKFSKLVRLILQNSQASLITLESELESLELYLNLEALRFNYHFEYTISVPKDMDIEVLKVPPLILQPYVENAIWHGLMHKEEKGHLDIRISEEADHVYFKVIDDGIGRKKASELSSKSATKHKSMGLRITAHRIAMLQSSNGLESPVKINDLLHPDGSAAGTEVVIKMPVIYD